VKEFYANLTNPSQKKREVVVRGKGVLYSEANVNRYFGIKDEEDRYEATLASMTEEEHHVTSETEQHSPVVGSQQRLPEVDEHSEAKASTDKPEPSQEVLQDKDVVEEEVDQNNEDDESEKSIDERDLLYDEEPIDEEKVSEEKEVHEEGPDGQGQNNAEKTTTDTPVEQAILKTDNSQPEEGKTAGEGAADGDKLATTEKVTAGNESPIIGAILRKKRTTKRKVVP
jgi:hypothetical protein